MNNTHALTWLSADLGCIDSDSTSISTKIVYVLGEHCATCCPWGEKATSRVGGFSLGNLSEHYPLGFMMPAHEDLLYNGRAGLSPTAPLYVCLSLSHVSLCVCFQVYTSACISVWMCVAYLCEHLYRQQRTTSGVTFLKANLL